MISTEKKPHGISWLAIMALTFIFVMRGVILLCVLPPFEAWDEFEHLGYVDHLSQYATNPVYGEANLDPGFCQAVARFPQSNGARMILASYGAVSYAEYWKARPTATSTAPIILYEAQHPPFYYWLMVPAYRLCGGRSDLALTVSVMRAINLGFAALSMVCILWWIRRNLTPLAGLLAGLCVCLQPMILQDLVRVANDPLAFLLGTIVICTCLSLRRPLFWRQCLLLAVALGLGTLAKAIDLTLVPVVCAGVILCLWRREVTWRHAAGGGALILAAFLVITGPYFAFNLRHFGILTPMQEAVMNRQAHRSLLSVIEVFPMSQAPALMWSWWVQNALWISGWSTVVLSMGFYRAHMWMVGILLLAVLVSLALKYSRQRWPMELRHVILMVLMLLCVTVGLFYHATASYSAWNGVIQTLPWYTMIGQPWLLILLVSGVVALIPRPSVAVAPLALLSSLYFSAEAFGLVYRIIPSYGAAGISWKGLRRLATLHPLWLGTPVMLGAQATLGGLIFLLIGIIVLQVRKDVRFP